MWPQLYGVCYCLSNSCAIVFRHNRRFDYRPQFQDRQKPHPLFHVAQYGDDIIGRELNLKKPLGRQWESNPQLSEQLRSITIKIAPLSKRPPRPIITLHIPTSRVPQTRNYMSYVRHVGHNARSSNNFRNYWARICQVFTPCQSTRSGIIAHIITRLSAPYVRNISDRQKTKQ